MDLIVYKQGTSQVTAIGILSDCISYTYEKQFNAPGDFTITLPYSDEYYKLVSREDMRDKLIQIDEYFLGIVYKVQKELKSNQKRIVVKGKAASNIYSHYIRQAISGSLNVGVYKDNVELDMGHLIQVSHLNQEQPGKVMAESVPIEITHYVNTNNMSKAALTTCPVEDVTYLSFLESSTAILGLGFDMTINLANKLESKLIYPKTRNNVILSTEFGDLYDSSYAENSMNYYASVVAVMLNNATSGPVSAFLYQDGIDRTKIDASQNKVYALTIDGSNVSVPSTKAMDYVQGLAKSFLANHRLVSVYDSNVNLANSKFVLGKDYNLGDTIIVQDKNLELQTSAVFSSFTKSVDSSGVVITPKFGFGQITLSTLLNRNGVTK